MLQIIFFSLVIMLASLVGVFSLWKKAGHIIEKNLSFLVSFSAGVFVIITVELAKETISQSPIKLIGISWIIVGALAIWLAFKKIPFSHHHHDEHEEVHHSNIDARKILISDGFHNIGDGILLASAFTLSFTLGVISTISIFVHEIVQELSEFFVLKEAGYTTKKALSLSFLYSSTILIGSIGSYLLLDKFEIVKVPILGIACGSFIIVILNDLIPHSVRASSSRNDFIKHLLWFILGLAVMWILGLISE